MVPASVLADDARMIILHGHPDFPSGTKTATLAEDFARRLAADAAPAGAAAPGSEDVLLFGHSPPRRMSAVLRSAPHPVVVAPAGARVRPWDQVVLGCFDDDRTTGAAATAGRLAARLGGRLRVVALDSEKPPASGWRIYDATRRAAEAAAAVTGAALEIDVEVRLGPPVEALLGAAEPDGSSVLVVAADPAPSWFDMLKPPFTSRLLRWSESLVVVVPDGSARSAPAGAAAAAVA